MKNVCHIILHLNNKYYFLVKQCGICELCIFYFLGILAMIIYYRFFHSKGPIPWKAHEDIELNNKVNVHFDSLTKAHEVKNMRSFKTVTQVDELTE